MSRGTSHPSSGVGPGSEGRSFQRTENWTQQARRLLKPEEVTALSSRVAITFTPGVPPLRTTLMRYYEETVPTSAEDTRANTRIVGRCAVFLVLTLGLTGWVKESVATRGAAAQWQGWRWESPAATAPQRSQNFRGWPKPRASAPVMQPKGKLKQRRFGIHSQG